ncbi:hypothetical protein [Fulvimarina sp. MAC3]|uniref:hypothetical protein n=1 Tax=Fulvimarina sp. MAC3 TaxID=3148887 RepID=UPI0031FE0A90
MSNQSSATPLRTRSRIAAVLAGVLVSTTALTAAQAQTTEPIQAPPATSGEASPASTQGAERAGEGERQADRMERRTDQEKRHAERRGGDWHKKHGWHHRRGGMGAMMTPARVATALAALETGIGITPEQMPVWRQFSSAATAFAIAAQPGPGPRGKRPGARGENASEGGDAMQPGDQTAGRQDDGASDTPNTRRERGERSPFEFIDRITQRAITSGEEAKRLQTASSELQEALTPEQVETATALVRSMMREARSQRGGRHEMRGHHGKHHGERHGDERGHHGQNRGSD